MDKMTYLMPWMNGYVASVDMAKHIPSPDDRKGTVKLVSKPERLMRSKDYKTLVRGV